jgi:hypothetical protein
VLSPSTRTATILAADAANYSRAMSLDERRALATSLARGRPSKRRGTISKFSGRISKPDGRKTKFSGTKSKPPGRKSKSIFSED